MRPSKDNLYNELKMKIFNNNIYKIQIKPMSLAFIVAILYGNGLAYLYELELHQPKLLPRLQVILQKMQMVAQESVA